MMQFDDAPAVAFRQLHGYVVQVAQELFMAEYFGHAVLEAYKALDRRVALQSNLNAGGKDLMARALHETGGPIDLSHERGQSGHDEREGFRFLAMGAMVGIRNPKSHELLRPISAARALDYLSVASLIMRRLDDALILRKGLTREGARKTIQRIEGELPGSVQSRLEGFVGYPSSAVPPVLVYCRSLDSWRLSYAARVASHAPAHQPRFAFESVRPGRYVVFAEHAVEMGGERLGGHYGGYTKYSVSGLDQKSKDHSLVEIEVGPGQLVSSIEVTDWYGFEPTDIYGVQKAELFGMQSDS